MARANDRKSQTTAEVAAAQEQRLDRAERLGRVYLTLMLFGALLGVILPSILFAENSRLFLLKVITAGLMAFLPGWLYLQFIRNKGRSLYDEYVLNLFRLHIDDYANLPAPPQHTTYYSPWKKAHGRLQTVSKDNLYRAKFEAIYGRTSVSTLRLILEDKREKLRRAETFSPVVYATLVLALGWVLILQPELLRALQLGDVRPSGRPVLPVEPLQFGFLGAYAFIVQDLVRRYYREDLRTTAYIGAIARIVFSAVVIVAVDIVWGAESTQINVLAFFIGFFPQVGLQVLQKALVKPLGAMVPNLDTNYPLSSLEGLNFWYQARLTEEGVEDMQHLVSASLVDLMLRTRAPIMRLIDWLDQAFLHLHLPGAPEDVRRLRNNLRSLGIRTASELQNSWTELYEDRAFCRSLAAALEVGADEVPAVVNSILIALDGETNYWHVRQFKSHPWLKSRYRGAGRSLVQDDGRGAHQLGNLIDVREAAGNGADVRGAGSS